VLVACRAAAADTGQADGAVGGNDIGIVAGLSGVGMVSRCLLQRVMVALPVAL